MLATIGGILLAIGAIASLVFWIMALVKAFKAGDTVWGVVGIFIQLAALIYLFTKGHTGLAVKWIIAVVITLIGYGMLIPTLMAAAQMQQ